MWLGAVLWILIGIGLGCEGRRTSRSIEPAFSLPKTSFRCQNQQFPGIFVDVEAGCRVFHFCESSGINATFYCPHLTLFNQQYFICDWSYNVECTGSEQYYSLNKDIYITPDKIFAGIQPYKQPAQPTKQLIQPAKIAPSAIIEPKSQKLSVKPLSEIADSKVSGSEVSRTLSSLVSQLDSRSSSLVEDTGLGDSPPSSGYRPAAEAGSISSPGPQGPVPEGEYGASTPLPSSTPPPPPPSYATTTSTTTTYYTTPTTTTIATTPAAYASPVYDDVADPEPDPVYSYAPLPTYSSAAQTTSYAAPVQPTYSAVAQPTYSSSQPTYSGPAAAQPTYTSAALPTYSSGVSGATYDDVADPEPTGYTGTSYDPAAAYDPYDSADPEPAAYYDSADPEPASYYADTIDLSAAAAAAPSYSGAATAQSGYSGYSSGAVSSGSGVYLDDAADPEPADYAYAQEINLVGGGAAQDKSSSSGYKLFSTASTITDFYKDFPANGYVVDSSDPEPDPEFTPYP